MSAESIVWGTVEFSVDPQIVAHAALCPRVLLQARIDAPRRQRVYVFVCPVCGWRSTPWTVAVRAARRRQTSPATAAGRVTDNTGLEVTI